MDDAPRILKSERWGEDLLPGNSKEMHWWAQSLESCRSVQWGGPPAPLLLSSATGTGLGPRNWLVLRLFSGVPRALGPGLGQSRINSSAVWVERKSFQGLSTLFIDKCSFWLTNEEKLQPRKVCFAWEEFDDSVSGLALPHVFGFMVKYFIPLCWKSLLGIH